MSEERIKISELVEELAARTGLDKNQAERLLKSLFVQVEQGLKNDGSVKINKFGTFKLQPIEARKSVDVTTGKEIMLDPYNKVTFAPDNEVKQRVNEPFAFLEPVIMAENAETESEDNDTNVSTTPTEEAIGQNLQKLDEQADEIKALLSDINGENWFMGANAKSEDILEDDLDEQEEIEEEEEEVSVEWEMPVADVLTEVEPLEQTETAEDTQVEESQVESAVEEPMVSLEIQENKELAEPLAENREIDTPVQETSKEEINDTPVEQEKPEQIKETVLPEEISQQQDKLEDNNIKQEQEIVTQEEKQKTEVLQLETKTEEPKVTEIPIPTVTAPTQQSTDDSTSAKKTEKKSSVKLWKIGAIIALAFCLILVGVYFYMVYKVETWANGKLEQARPETEWIESLEEEPVIEQESSESAGVGEPSKPTMVEESQQQTGTEPLSVFDQPRNYDKLIATEQLTEGSRLAWLAKKYYGDARFWVYIYEANMDHIPDPNNIAIGTTIKVPELPKALIDANNPACIDYAKQLHERFIK